MFFLVCLSVGSFKVDAMTLSGEVPVSVCAQKRIQDGHQHWLITMEQVERISASISLAQDVIGIFTYFLLCFYKHLFHNRFTSMMYL